MAVFPKKKTYEHNPYSAKLIFRRRTSHKGEHVKGRNIWMRKHSYTERTTHKGINEEKGEIQFQFQSNMAIGSCAKETSTIAMKPKKNLKERKCWYKKNRNQSMDGRFSKNLIFELSGFCFPSDKRIHYIFFNQPLADISNILIMCVTWGSGCVWGAKWGVSNTIHFVLFSVSTFF